MSDTYTVTFTAGDPTPGRRKDVWDATAAPIASDDSTRGLSVGSLWLDTVAGKVYLCADATEAAAVWVDLGGVEDHVAAANPKHITVSASAPETPAVNDLWLDIS